MKKEKRIAYGMTILFLLVLLRVFKVIS